MSETVSDLSKLLTDFARAYGKAYLNHATVNGVNLKGLSFEVVNVRYDNPGTATALLSALITDIYHDT